MGVVRTFTIAALLCGTFAAAAHANSDTRIGRWHYSAKPDEVDETNSYLAFVIADDTTMFGLKCGRPGHGSIFAMLLDSDMGAADTTDDLRAIRYRVDKLPPVDDNWLVEDEYLQSGDDDSLARMLDSMTGGKRLLIRADIGHNMEHTYQFDITGSQQAIARLRKDCQD